MSKTNSESENATCSFCGRPEEDVEKLISGPTVFICDKCVHLCMDIISKKPQRHELKVLKPIEIKEKLDEYIIGQNFAKKTISVAVYNHYKRIRSAQSDKGADYSKSNVLLFGPTGSGKTLIARTLAKILDVENIVLRLLQNADYDVERAEQGIIYVDEVDKLRKTTQNVSITRDVSGEGVQQALLKIVEGTVANVPPKGGRKHPNQEYIKINTENILFIAGGAFVHLDKIIAKRLGKGAIGFGAEEGQETISDTNKLLSLVETEDLIQFGLIPEFVGRFNTIANCNELSVEDLVTILTEPKNAIVKQYQKLFEEDGVVLTFSDKALRAIARRAKEIGTGARALRMMIENLLMEAMYESPSDQTIEEIIVEEDAITKKAPLMVRRKNPEAI